MHGILGIFLRRGLIPLFTRLQNANCSCAKGGAYSLFDVAHPDSEKTPIQILECVSLQSLQMAEIPGCRQDFEVPPVVLLGVCGACGPHQVMHMGGDTTAGHNF